MKVLFYNDAVSYVNHMAETVELMLRHLKKGDEVFLITCNQKLPTCPANISNDPKICKKCIKIKDRILSKVLDNKVHEIKLPDFSMEYPKIGTKNLAELKGLKTSFDIGKLLSTQLVENNRDSSLNISDSLLVDRLVGAGTQFYKYVSKVLSELEINKVYVWNGRRVFDGAIVQASIALGVDYRTHISYWLDNSKIYITNSPLVHDLTALKLRHRQVLKALNKPKSNEVLMSQSDNFYHSQRYGGSLKKQHTYSDYTKNKISLPSSSKKRLVIFSSSNWETYGLDGFQGAIFSDPYAAIEEIASHSLITENWQIIVRWHPNLRFSGHNEKKRINEIINRSADKINHFSFDDDVNSYEILEQSDAVITFGSTIGAEATFYKKPSILLAPAEYKHLNVTYNPESLSEFLELLEQPELAPKPQIQARYFGYIKQNNFGLMFKNLSNDTGKDLDFHYDGKYLLSKSFRIKGKAYQALHKLAKNMKS